MQSVASGKFNDGAPRAARPAIATALADPVILPIERHTRVHARARLRILARPRHRQADHVLPEQSAARPA
ncbi:hypothetical protein EFP19_05930 [Burkholderia glumae]|nr:hypothetical protein EFP19_05930 [Burkholderia glumae]